MSSTPPYIIPHTPQQVRGDRNLAVYIHWPFCRSKCPYCDFNSHVREAVDQNRWKNALLQELGYMAGQTPGRIVTSIFFGGGTPSLMPPETAAALIEEVGRLWPVDPDIEITLEANPTSVEALTFAEFAAAGINRVSLGVQSLDDEELRFLGREHSAKEALAAVDRARQVFARHSFDLIYARPNQTVAHWRSELAQALEYVGSHMSLYQLTIEPNTAFAHAYAKKQFALPSEEVSEALYRTTEDMLGARGLLAYEVSNYATPGDESRHNFAYWRGQEYVGIGPGAHGRLVAGGVRVATQTLKSPERWLEKVLRDGQGLDLWEDVPRAQEIEERIMMGLRLRSGINVTEFYAQTGVHLSDVIDSKKWRFYQEQGLLTNTENYLQPTLRGHLVLTSLTAELLP